MVQMLKFSCSKTLASALLWVDGSVISVLGAAPGKNVIPALGVFLSPGMFSL